MKKRTVRKIKAKLEKLANQFVDCIAEWREYTNAYELKEKPFKSQYLVRK